MKADYNGDCGCDERVCGSCGDDLALAAWTVCLDCLELSGDQTDDLRAHPGDCSP